MNAPLLLLVNGALACVLLGLILTIQFVHYPAFADVGEEAFRRFHALHERRITPLVGPLMAAELLAAAALVWHRPEALPGWAALASLALVGFVWLDTALWAVPVHQRLGAGLDAPLVASLLRANAWRTVAWAARVALLAPFVARLVR